MQSASPSSDGMAVVKTWDLCKTYRTGFWLNKTGESLKSCSLEVLGGETFGLLGPNGAGKTTLLKILLGIIRPTAGNATLLGKPFGDRQTRQRIGYLPENAYFYDFLTAWEFLDFTAGLFQIPRGKRQKRIKLLLDTVGLAQEVAKKRQLRKYSKGMLQRVGMAQALINDPDLVFLDEPMSGLDPLGRYQVREIILSLKAQGKTIFFNSHILADVELICDRLAILSKGEIICQGTLDELLGAADRYQVVIEGGTEAALRSWVPDLARKDHHWIGHLEGDPQKFIASLSLMKARLLDLKLARVSLEDFFIRQIRDHDPQAHIEENLKAIA
ncbi:MULTISPECIES: ABC transporter ATP-binding protein [Cyanophyceae]|uniref:ABC transporter ATP-binding protein n=1 Tax=Cyanophyceae TaxID=3028117 RepID=UPI00016DC797|nr:MULTISPECIES: ABC transporter ATP-binding protein [Cyanophyceae]ACA98180.1 ABC transporter, ATP-binding protein [Picosynechococcus sp. PCC 7002]SMH44222.1 ABC-2 type transport system ATP-binding protein [Picosynechococcus sp. OG1]SMQ79689.1 ABC-2 type transport system ATP-binding protein [Synechococcus sp. 7002]